MTKRVLFLCDSNMARSIMAEAILNKQGAGAFEAASAGVDPAGMVSPFAIEVLKDHGYPTDGLASKGWEEFQKPDAPAFDYVISASSGAREAVRAEWRGGGEILYWPVTDPVLVEGNQTRMRASFEDVFDGLEKYIATFVAKER